MFFKLVVDQFEKVISATAVEKRSVLLGRMFMENYCHAYLSQLLT